MPVFKTKNENFFKIWSPEMAYVLGFFTADGSMIENKRGGHFIEFEITDKDLLYKIRELLESNHKITRLKKNKRWKNAYRLQIGSKEIYNDLLKLGLTSKKSKTIELPDVPEKYFSDFVRGYFDGDGNVTICNYIRKDRNNRKSTTILSGFTSGSKKILESLQHKLKSTLDLNGGIFNYNSGGYRLYFSVTDTRKLYNFMYNSKNNLFLDRKKNKFEKYFKMG